MKIIGILGGVASGKSVVAKRLQELGAEALDADVVAHQVLREEDVKLAIRKRFGDGVIDEDDQVNRSALAKIVFAEDGEDRDALADLEAIMHPRIGALLEQQMQRIQQDGRAKAIVLDAAVMMKAGWHKLCDVLVFVDVSPEVRVQRSASRGWSNAEVAAREARQTPVSQKQAAADFVVDNSGTLAQTYAQVDRFWAEHVQLPARN